MIRYHDSPTEYEREVQDRDEDDLFTALADYTAEGSARPYLTTGQYGQDHRAWRRAVIREALRRGLISDDPGDAP